MLQHAHGRYAIYHCGHYNLQKDVMMLIQPAGLPACKCLSHAAVVLTLVNPKSLRKTSAHSLVKTHRCLRMLSASSTMGDLLR